MGNLIIFPMLRKTLTSRKFKPKTNYWANFSTFNSNKQIGKVEEIDRSKMKTTDIIDTHYGLKQFIKN